MDEIGEFGLIERIAALLDQAAPAGDHVALGIGDDAAIWNLGVGAGVVVTTDTLVEEIHFRLDIMSWEDLGHRSLAVNLSDLAAMGALARVAVVTLGLRGDEQVEDVLAFYRGMARLAARHGVAIIGGDIVAAPRAITINVTALGEQATDNDGAGISLRRDAARPGDLLAVTGPLGGSAAGLALLLASGGDQTDPLASNLLRAYRRPEPRLAEAATIIAAGVRSGMDLSDGLGGDLPKICARSSVSATVEVARLPVPLAVRQRFPDRWLEMALRGGEDFELLIAAPADRLATADKALVDRGLAPLVVIGRVEPPGDQTLWLLHPDGRREPLRPGAFDHFSHA